MKIAWFPKSTDLSANPYWTRLHDALERIGVEFEHSHNSYWMKRRWLLAHRYSNIVLHFHFVQPQYVGANDHASLRRLLKFAADLLLARLLGYRIVWTMHDLMPTWPKEPKWVERLARHVIAMMSHDIIVHCQEAKRLLAKQFWRSWRVHVMPLPSYTDAHPNDITDAEARDRLQIGSDRFVTAFVGGIRPNKGLEELIDAFTQIEDAHAILLIAGRPWPPHDYIERIEEMVQDNGRIVLHAHEVPDADVQAYLKAADVLVFPFKQILTSSSVVLAMSFGRPVIVPQLGCLTELVGDDAGIVYDPTQPNALRDAICAAIDGNLIAMGQNAYKHVESASWMQLAQQMLEVYVQQEK